MNRDEDNKSAKMPSRRASSRWKNKSKHYSSIHIYLMLLSMSKWFRCWMSFLRVEQEIASEINCIQCKLWKVCQHIVEIGKCASVDLLLLQHFLLKTLTTLSRWKFWIYDLCAPWTYAITWSSATPTPTVVIDPRHSTEERKEQELNTLLSWKPNTLRELRECLSR